MAIARDELHHLVDLLPEERLDVARRALGAVAERDPLEIALALAPEDDEPLSPEDLRAIEESRAQIACDEVERLCESSAVRRDL